MKRLLLFFVVLLFLAKGHTSELPVCSPAAIDPDGDGYGWENSRSCLVQADELNADQCQDRGDYPWGWNESTGTSCLLGIQTEPSACVDSDGDGYGWNGLATCIVATSHCEDRGGYPWGWNPSTMSSCRLDESPVEPVSQCADTDGDGNAALTPLFENTTGGETASIDGIVYYNGYSAETGSEVMFYDSATGTSAILADINPGPFDSIPSNFVELNGHLYFTAFEPNTGRDFWVYDPAVDEFPRPFDFLLDIDLQLQDIPRYLTVLDGKLYFTAEAFGRGVEMLVYDPEADSLNIVEDINPGEDGSSPNHLTVAGGKLYFTAEDGVNGQELWVHDPTENTTNMLFDLSENVSGSQPINLVVHDNKLYFRTQSGNQLRVYDVIQGGRPDTVEFVVNGVATDGTILNAVGEYLYLRIDDEAGNTGLWRYSPLIDATSQVADLASARVFAVGDSLYFTGTDANSESALWRYNESAGDVQPVIDSSRPDLDSPGGLSVHDGRLYFSAFDNTAEGFGRRTWVYDTACD